MNWLTRCATIVEGQECDRLYASCNASYMVTQFSKALIQSSCAEQVSQWRSKQLMRIAVQWFGQFGLWSGVYRHSAIVAFHTHRFISFRGIRGARVIHSAIEAVSCSNRMGASSQILKFQCSLGHGL